MSAVETVSPLPEIIQEIRRAGCEAFRFCYQCGKCDVVCPWNRVTNFSIRKIIRQADLGLPDIELDDIWRCTTCGTCPARCPRGVEQIDVVVISHGHLDHVAGIMEGGKPLFPNARYVISGTEYDFWAPAGKHTGQMEDLAAIFRANFVPVADRASFLKPGDDVVAGIRSMEATGHTPGHLAFMLESNGERMLFWGDCAHHQVASLARPDWHCVFDFDKEQGAATRRRIYEMAAAERLAVAGYHMPFPSLGYVERRPEGGYRWLAHTYQLSMPPAG